MALQIADRIKETSVSTGTSALTLAGAMTGFRAFSSVCTSPSDTCYYALQAVDGSGVPTGDWEVGLGTYSAANTLTRTTVLASSNAGDAVSLAAGTKQVWMDMTAAQFAKLNPGSGTKWDHYSNYAASIIAPDFKTLIGSSLSGSWASTRADTSRASGKLYLEYKLLALAGTYSPMSGVGKSTVLLTNYCGSDADGWGILATGGMYNNGSSSAQTAYAAGDVVGIAVDFTASTGSIKFYKNNVANGSFTSLTLAALFPIWSISSGSSGASSRLCTRSADCTYTPPAGYSYWDS